ncbi:MAG: tRNA-(ms[2]io[6]A)-hydroxylase [Polyangiaceae bacterium]|nr:tRNA-(ms[2]io[6]A)-hydroxylase [Polyangiaceae bacterium]
MFNLRSATPEAWLKVVFGDFNSFLLDHAACERKASATGMSFVVKYPDRTELLEPMIEFAKEELEHFHIVFKLLTQRGLRLLPDYKDAYVNGLLSQLRPGTEALFLDRLLVAGVVEARGCERLKLIADNLEGELAPLRPIYEDLARAESRHHALFFRLARRFFDPKVVQERADFLLDFEADWIGRLPHTPHVH